MKTNHSLLLSGILLTVMLVLSCSGASGLCNGVNYDKDIYRCEFGELIGKCKGKDYYAAYDRCVNGIVVNNAVSSSNSDTSVNGVVVNSTSSSSNSDTFTDSRDGKTYKWVKIGKQVWMAKNLNYNASGSKCYDNKSANCQKYGRLYNWNTAMKVCPKGWHLPSNAEWDVLVAFAGGDKIAVKKLKAKSGWNSGGNGDDAFGFAALPGGLGGSDGYFDDVGYYGRWWSASETSANGAYGRLMHCYDEGAYWYSYVKDALFSVRCLQD
jgi:uncharacterized protein (TIGR02145 family)